MLRASAVDVATEDMSATIRSLDVQLPQGFEAFRLHVAAAEAGNSSADRRQTAFPRPSAKTGGESLDLGDMPTVFLIWREHDFPHLSLASQSGTIVRSVDALLFQGQGRQVLLEVSGLPTWIDVMYDAPSITKVLDAAHDIELLS